MLSAFIIEMARRALGRPDPGVPAYVSVALPPGAGEPEVAAAGPLPAAPAQPAARVVADVVATATTAAASDAASDDGAPAAPAAPVVTAVPVPVAAAPTAADKAAALKAAADAATRAVDVVHVPVDAEHGAASEAWRLVGPYLRRYGGGALSSSTLWNPEFIHCFVPGVGSQAYVVGRAYHRTIVVGIGDPLAARGHWPTVLRAFKRAFPHATFAHVGAEYARLIKEQEGMQINDMGAETNVLVQSWAYSKKTRTIRNSARDARAAGVAVRELTAADVTPDVARQLERVTGDWVQHKSVGDTMLRVFIRHVDYNALHLDEGVRLFVAERDVAAAAAGGADSEDGGDGDAAAVAATPRVERRIEGFVLADPLWRDGAVHGYVISLNRMRRDGHHGALKLLYEELFATAKAEGKDLVTFGFSPFFNLQTEPFRGPLWSEVALRFLFEYGNNLYDFKNLAFSKARYGGSVVGDAYKDPNVTMTHVYGAHLSAWPTIAVLDHYVMMMYVGFLGDLKDTLFKLTGLRRTIANSFSDEDSAALVRSASAWSVATSAAPSGGGGGGDDA